jgi:hypothetical protein
MKKITLSLLGLLLIQVAGSQNVKFGKVSKEELKEKVHPLDSSASAAVLYRSESISFFWTDDDGFMQDREIHERIKIYDKEGYDWATKKIYLYEAGSGFKEKLKSLKAYTYNFENGKVVKEKLGKEAIFEEDYNEVIEINTITFPNINEGCIVEYTYKVQSPFIEIDDIIFQYDIPINKFDLRVETPQYYRYNRELNLRALYYPKITESKGKKTRYVSGNTDYIGTGLNGRSNSTSGFTDEYEVNILHSEAENIPALKEESYVGSIDNYRAKMSMELSAFVDKIGITKRSFSTSWESVSEQIFNGGTDGSSNNLSDQINRKGFFEEELASQLNGVSDPFEKAGVINAFVKSKVKWNGMYGYMAQKGVKKAFKEGESNTGDINLLLLSMLRSQGLEAYPVLVSTRDNGVPLFPTRKGFNYLVALVVSGDNYALLDATSPFGSLNSLPQRAVNWQGRLIKDDGTSMWVPLRPNKPALEATSLNVMINEDHSLSGKVRQTLTGNIALNYRTKNAGLTQESHTTRLESDKGNIEISNLQVENDMNPNAPLKITYDYTYNDGLDALGDRIYLDPMLFLKTTDNPFKADKRSYPIDFVYPFEDKYLINIMLPDGYEVSSLPSSERLVFQDQKAEFSYISKLSGKYLQFIISLKVHEPIIASQDYENFKNFFTNLVTKENEQIVLLKNQ